MNDNLLSELNKKTIEKYRKAIEDESDARLETSKIFIELLKETEDSFVKVSSEEFKKFILLPCDFNLENGEGDERVATALARVYLAGNKIISTEEKKSFLFVKGDEIENSFPKMEFKDLLIFIEEELKSISENLFLNNRRSFPPQANESSVYRFYIFYFK